MTDQQDLRARLLPVPQAFFDEFGKSADDRVWDYARACVEAAAQLGRVGEPVRYVRWHPKHGYAWGHTDNDPFPSSINDGEWINVALYTSPQLPAGVPDGWALVPVKPTESMLEALGNTPWVIDGHTEGNTFIQKEYRDQRYVTDGWEAMLNAAPSPPATPQPDSAAPGGDVERRARELEAVGYAVPSQEGYSNDGGDTWYECPDDSAFVDGLAVGDTYDLEVCHLSVTRTYRVTKAPDDESDDYAVEPVALLDGAKAGKGESE